MYMALDLMERRKVDSSLRDNSLTVVFENIYRASLGLFRVNAPMWKSCDQNRIFTFEHLPMVLS